MNFELNKKKGLSGCELELINNNIVRKYSSNLRYNDRLEIQMRKQKIFKNDTFEFIKTPKIVDSGFINQLFYFDMEYISGQQLYDLFIFGTKNDINNFIKYLNSYFDYLIKNSKFIEINHFKISNKLKLESLIIDSDYKSFIKYLISKIDDVKSKSFISSDCHGDFTIGNMIYYNNCIYLLDFLDSYIDTPIIDLVKLKQDLFHNWLLLNSDYNKSDFYRAVQISKFVWGKISKKYLDYINTIEFKILEAINFLRIEPYIDVEKKLLLNKIIKSLELYEEFNNTYGWEIE